MDETWRRKLVELPWPTRNLPEVMGDDTATLQALIREYLIVSLFRACALRFRRTDGSSVTLNFGPIMKL